MSHEKRTRPAFTLLEVVLASALTAIVLGVIYMMVDIQLRAVNSSRGNVEEALLARAVLQRIGDDVRGAIPYDPLQSDLTMKLPVSASDLTKALAASAGSGLTGASGSSGSGVTGSSGSGATGAGSTNTGSTGGSGASTGTGASSGTSSTDTTSTDDGTSANTTGTIVPKPTPGLYGETDWLQVDVSRLPRADQMLSDVTLSPGSLMIDRVSDVKTVKYEVISPQAAGGLASPQGSSGQTGLLRIEMDRAAATYQAQNGGVDPASQSIESLAPEVAAVQFRYFDGLEWLDFWDSQGFGGLPWAVEITLWIIPPDNRSVSSLSQQPAATGASPDDANQTLVQHTFVVYLPAARATLAQTGSSSSDSTGGETGSTSGTTTPTTP